MPTPEHSTDDTSHSADLDLPELQGFDGDRIVEGLARNYEYGLIPTSVEARVKEILAITADAEAPADVVQIAIEDALLILRFTKPRPRPAPALNGEAVTPAPKPVRMSEPPRLRPMDGFAPNQDPGRTRDAVNMIIYNALGPEGRLVAIRPSNTTIDADTWRLLSERHQDQWDEDDVTPQPAQTAEKDKTNGSAYRGSRRASTGTWLGAFTLLHRRPAAKP